MAPKAGWREQKLQRKAGPVAARAHELGMPENLPQITDTHVSRSNRSYFIQFLPHELKLALTHDEGLRRYVADRLQLGEDEVAGINARSLEFARQSETVAQRMMERVGSRLGEPRADAYQKALNKMINAHRGVELSEKELKQATAAICGAHDSLKDERLWKWARGHEVRLGVKGEGPYPRRKRRAALGIA